MSGTVMSRYFQRQGLALPVFMAIMAAISLFILSSNVPAPVAEGKETMEHLLIVWGTIMATGSILVLFGYNVGLHVFAFGAFAECAMILIRGMTEGTSIGGAFVGLMPVIAYIFAKRRGLFA